MQTARSENRWHRILWLGVSIWLLFTPGAQASSIVFFNSVDFFAAVGPSVAYRISNVPNSPGFAGLPFGFDNGAFPFPGGTTSFELDEPPTHTNSLTIGDFSPRYPGNEMAVRGLEEITASAFGLCSASGCLPEPAFHAFGFNIVEPRFDTGTVQSPDAGSPFIDSMFLVTLEHVFGHAVDSFVFNVPNDTAAFVGVWSSEPLQRVYIRELTDDPGDELFGDFFVAQTVTAVPEPSSIAILATGLAGLLRHRRRLWK